MGALVVFRCRRVGLDSGFLWIRIRRGNFTADILMAFMGLFVSGQRVYHGASVRPDCVRRVFWKEAPEQCGHLKTLQRTPGARHARIRTLVAGLRWVKC